MNLRLAFSLDPDVDAQTHLNDLEEQLRELADQIQAGWYVDLDDLPYHDGVTY